MPIRGLVYFGLVGSFRLIVPDHKIQMTDFVVSGVEQVEKFANAIEESYQESLKRTPEPDMKITHLRGTEEVKKFMAKRKMTND